MSWFALDNLDPAMEKTKEILLPFDFWTWTKIGIIALLVGGGFDLPSVPNAPYGSGQASQGMTTPDIDVNDSGDNISQFNNMTGMATSAGLNAVTVAVFAVLLVIAGFFMYLSSVFQFIYYQTILDEEPRISEGFSKHAGKGLRYLGFKLAFGFAVILSGVLLYGAFQFSEVIGAVALLLWIPLIVGAAIFYWLVNDFVPLRMIESEESVLQAWSSIWPDIKSQWRQLVVYWFVKLFISAGIVFALLFIVASTILLLLIPFGILAVLLALISPVLVIPVAIIGVIVFSVIMFYVEVPFSTFVYTYVTLFYHDLTS